MRTVVCALVAALAFPANAAGGERRVGIFYYPWYGNPQSDGRWIHWRQRRPAHGLLASAYYPARGAYSGGDARVVRAHMRDIAAARVDDVIVSWWGRGSLEDRRLPLVLREARRRGLSVSAHLEPYGGRTVASTDRDIAHLRARGIRDFYVFGATMLPAAEWRALNRRLRGVRLFANTALVGRALAGGFDGIYTYDLMAYRERIFARICAQAHRKRLLCAPSVGPGFDARRATGIPGVRPRRNGRTYDSMWRTAVAARADAITVTSYNEWHEGTQIEPARRRRGYASYDGAYGLRGRSAERAYLARTALWARRYEAERR